MDPIVRIRIVSAGFVVAGLLAAGVLGLACNPMPPDGHAVMGGDCVSCHELDFEAAKEPLHVDLLPTTCGDCHDEKSWSPASKFDHQRFRESSKKACVDCHRHDYETAEKPSHATIDTDCASCHEESAWRPATFDHAWPLTGAHVTADCTSCHVGDPPVYEGTKKLCVDCHRKDYDGSPFPGHASFATTCQDCHTTTAWLPATFDHAWPLTGAHAMARCASCHLGDPPKYEGTSTLCVDCHRKKYDDQPIHAALMAKTTCQDCHTTSAWLPASFTHEWELTGKHATARCASCHGEPPKYVGTSKLCVDCHRDDYDSSPYPGHSTFATTCESCHTTSGWTPASGGHPEAKFPIKTGKHTNVSCAQCHNPSLGPTGKGNADCIGCHEHSSAETAGHHGDVSGYMYSNKSCLGAGCHYDGRVHGD